MTTATTNRRFGPGDAFWDVAYQVVVIGLGIVATAAIYLEISGI